MNEDDQKIAIAEACGWTVINGYICHVTPDKNNEPVIATIAPLSDYLNDLNAMHEAEKVLTADQARAYDKEQQKIGFRERLAGAFWMWHLPANWKAEAFLRTIGKWVE